MEKKNLFDEWNRKKINSFYENLRTRLREFLPYELRRWFVRAYLNKRPKNPSSNLSPDLFSREMEPNQICSSLMINDSPIHNDPIQGQFGKVVIIIPSYNNLVYLRLCLNSIWKKTGYQYYKVIVVDNGSDSDVIEFLTTTESIETKLSVIYNEENIGFARAINTGIEAAGDCEFVVILNDDTIVTQGWLIKLIQYLEISDIKLVGPVTNWAGNEARIKVDYDDLDSMEQFAYKYCSSHEGQFFDIPMLAMYCVIMRRSLLEEIGLLDERFGIGMFEDDDFSLRVRKTEGRIICVEDVFIHHWGRTAINKMDQEEYERLFNENRRKYEEKWKIRWKPHLPRYRREKEKLSTIQTTDL